jgi:hypothetical protein
VRKLNLDEELDYEEFFSNLVDEEYLEEMDEDGWKYARKHSEDGGTPKACVALGLSETENLDWNYDEIASELDISRKALYNAREKYGLVPER